MTKYWYVLNEDGTIKVLYKQKAQPKNGVQITRVQYDKYLEIIRNVPEKDGYEKTIHLYPDFTYTVEYAPIVIEEEEE